MPVELQVPIFMILGFIVCIVVEWLACEVRHKAGVKKEQSDALPTMRGEHEDA